MKIDEYSGTRLYMFDEFVSFNSFSVVDLKITSLFINAYQLFVVIHCMMPF